MTINRLNIESKELDVLVWALKEYAQNHKDGLEGEIADNLHARFFGLRAVGIGEAQRGR